MKSIIFGFGFSLFLVGCAPSPQELNARMEKQWNCLTRAQKTFETDIDECIKKFGVDNPGYKACSDTAGDRFDRASLNCNKLDER